MATEPGGPTRKNEETTNKRRERLLLRYYFIKAITPILVASFGLLPPAAASPMASRNHGPSPPSLSTPLLSDTIAPTRALSNGHANHHDAASTCDDGGGDPFAFLSEDRPPRDRGPSPADPFRNATPGWAGGLYCWLRTLLCAPVAAVRLVLFGLSIAVGYAATWLALRGWVDVQDRPREGSGPMPAWRRRLMWITRISARFILFSFG